MSDESPYRAPIPEPKAPPPMFGNFEAAKHRKAPPWAAPVMIAAIVFHVGFFLIVWIKTIWELPRLDPPKVAIDLAVAPAPPPPPPPPKGGAKPTDPHITLKKRQVKDIVQPVKVEKPEVQQVATTDEGDPNGQVGGQEGGDPNGDINGEMGAPPPPPPPPPPPKPPKLVAPQMLEGSRIAGEKEIHPDTVTQNEIIRSGKTRLVGSFKVCLDTSGAVSGVTMIKSTGFAAYDNKITSTIHSQWRYRPYNVGGQPVPVCTAVTFIYSQ